MYKVRNERNYITGLGIHSCLGEDIPSFAKALHDGKCGLYHDTYREKIGYQSCLCGAVPQVAFKYTDCLSRAQRQCFSLPTYYALSAVRQALEEAKVSDDFLKDHHVSLIVSNDSTADAMMDIGTKMQRTNDTRCLGAGAVFRSLNSTASMNLASLLGIHGLSLTVSAACAGGGHAIGLAQMLLNSHQTEMVIVVGMQEAGPSSMQSFDALGVFATDAVRPFDKHRSGLAPSGGAACVILESEYFYRMRKEDEDMKDERLPMFVGVDIVRFDLGVSRAKAYEVIKELNKEMKEENPRAIVVKGKVNRIWYEEACLKRRAV